MHVGILYPRSGAHPSITKDFVDGIRAALAKPGYTDTVRLSQESIGFGGSEKEVYEKAEKLLHLEDVDILVAYIDLRVLKVVEPLGFTAGRPVIIVNPGANYPDNWIPQPNIIHLSALQAFCCWMTGRTVPKGSTAILASSFYDCGYLQTAAMVRGLESREGSISFNYINRDKYDESFSIEALDKFLEENPSVKNLLCIFDSLPANLFMERLASNASRELQLFVSPMMLPCTGLPKTRVEGFTTQPPGMTENIFAMLGNETGSILAAIFEKGKAFIRDGKKIAALLETIPIESPRGPLQFDSNTHCYISKVYHYKQEPGSLPDIDESFPGDEWKEFCSRAAEPVSSGWTNTYLCY